MSYGTILQQGKFTSDGDNKVLQLRSDVDWMRVYNYTEIAGQNDNATEFYWQLGMDDNAGVQYFKNGGADNLNVSDLTTTGFKRIDSSGAEFGASVAITSSTDATQPSFLVVSTSALSTGDVVRTTGVTGQETLSGFEFEIEVVDGTHFKPRYAFANSPGAAGTAGNYRLRNFAPLFKPNPSFIIDVSSASSGVFTLAAGHSFIAGDRVRLSFDDSAWGDFQDINGVSGLVESVTASTVTLDVDTTGLGAFAYPLPDDPFTFAQMSLIGVNSNLVSAASDNVGYIAMRLIGGTDAPGGANTDVMYWVAGKAVQVTNE